MDLEQLRIKRIGDALIPYINSQDKILDIGSGNCSLGDYLKGVINIDYHGVDIVKHKVAPELSFTCSDMPYPFEDKSFDIVLLILTLHHFDNPEAGLQEAIRLSKKRILLLEDVPRNNLERFFMKIIDFTGNRIVSKDIPLPYNFYNDLKWKEIFVKYKLMLNNRVNVYPLPFPRLNHYLYEVIL